MFVKEFVDFVKRSLGNISNVNNLVVVWYQEREYSIKLTEI